MRRFFLLLLLCAWGPLAQAADADAAFRARFGEDFLDRYWQLHPDAAIAVGYYRYADRLPAPNAPQRQALASFLNQQIAALGQLPVAELGPAARTDYELLLNQLRYEKWLLESLRDWQWQPSLYNVADSFALLLGTEYASLETRLRTVSQRLTQVPAYYAAAARALRHPTQVHTQLAIQQNEGALAVFGDALQQQLAASSLPQPEKDRFLRRLHQARAAIEGYVAALKKLDAKETAYRSHRDFRLGQPLYDEAAGFLLQTGDTPEALYQRAQREKAVLHQRMGELADRLWPTYFDTPAPADRLAKIARLIAKLSEQHARPAEFYPQIEALIPRLEAWVDEHQLLAQDPSRPLAVRQTPPHQRGYAMALLAAPGPYDPTARTYFNVTPLDDFAPAEADSFLREYNRWLMQVLAIHEAVPGHYLQLIYANKSPSRIKALFGNSAMVEGWAVYAERLMMESGWGGREPEMQLMYGKWLLRIVCNTLLDVGVHVHGLQETEALRLLRDEAFQTDTEARGKWRRVQLSSVQLSYYFAGYTAIYQLRQRQRARLGAAFDLRRFNEQFLSYGNAPVSMIAQLMEAGADGAAPTAADPPARLP